jgi:hypothetical protein
MSDLFTPTRRTQGVLRFAPIVPFLLALFVLQGCAHGPTSTKSTMKEPVPAASSTPSPSNVSPSDVASVPPHTGTVVYEAVQPDPSNMVRDLVLVLYADRKAVLLDRVIGDPTTKLQAREGIWSLSDAGSVRLSLDEKDGTDREIILKRGEGYLTGDGSAYGGGILYLREI